MLTPDKEKRAQAQAAEKAKKAAAKPAAGPVQQLRQSLGKLSVQSSPGSSPGSTSRSSAPPTPKLALSREQILSQLHAQNAQQVRELGLVVVGHVDAGKSTLMGRMLVELGQVSEREHQSNARQSAKMGKGSFAYAWALDSSEEERARGITIDVAQDSFRTDQTVFHLLDAPGHSDFVPNMISGAAQADAGVLVIDAITGAFEAGFGPRGQTREHATLLRSLGVQQLIVVVNKLDAMAYSQARYDEICAHMRPFLQQCGFDLSKHVTFVPCAALEGENLRQRSPDGVLATWYTGSTLSEALDQLQQPPRLYDAPLRLPVSNVFKGGSALSSGLGVSGRILSGFVQVGEVVRAQPGGEWGTVKAIEMDGDLRPWAAAGSSVTLYLNNLESNQVHVGSLLSPPSALVPLAKELIVQVLVFQPTYPLVRGTAVEVYHHSADIPGQLTDLMSILDKGSGEVVRRQPRVLQHNVTALVRVKLGHGARDASGFPMEDFKTNKEMARVLFRMNSETVAAGIVVDIL